MHFFPGGKRQGNLRKRFLREMNNAKILIVDDGSSVNPAWNEKLGELGFDVRIFRENGYILSLIAKEEPALLILGLSHLWLNGTNFVNKLSDWLHRLRHIDRFSRLPIIL